MNHYVVQEFLSVLLVIAVATGTFLGFALSFVLLQEGIRRAVHAARTHVIPIRGLSAKDQWLQRNHSRSALR